MPAQIVVMAGEVLVVLPARAGRIVIPIDAGRRSICDLIDRPPIYHETEPGDRRGPLRSDQFYGQPLATVARQVLELQGSAMTVAAIFERMVEGGFQFDTKDQANAKRNLRISLSKNAVTFHKLPNGTCGLLEWYPNVKNGGKSRGARVDESVAGDEATPTEAEAEEPADPEASVKFEEAKAMKG